MRTLTEDIKAAVEEVLFSEEFLSRFAAAVANMPLQTTIEVLGPQPGYAELEALKTQRETHVATSNQTTMAQDIAVQIEGGGYTRTD